MARNTTVAKATTPVKVSAQGKVLERKALAESNKSAGMRLLFEAGYTVSQVRALFNAPYGYVYGVAKRAGFAETAAQRKGTGKATAKPAAKATTAAKKATASRPSAAQRVAAKLATKPGRPSPARRAANRKAAVAAK